MRAPAAYPTKLIEEIKAELVELIQNSKEDTLPKGDIQEAMKQNSAWNIVKKFGQAAIPSGDAQTQFNELRGRLESLGVFLVHVGEIENFCRDIGSHGPKFVSKLLSGVPFDDSRLGELKEFVERVHKGPHAPLDESPKDEVTLTEDEPQMASEIAASEVTGN